MNIMESLTRKTDRLLCKNKSQNDKDEMQRSCKKNDINEVQRKGKESESNYWMQQLKKSFRGKR